MLYYKFYGPYMGDLGINRTTTGDAGVSPHLCTSAIARGNLTENDGLAGAVIHGKNMDGENDLRKVTVNSLLAIATDPGPGAKRTVGIDWSGFIGTFNGMNEDGLVLVPHSSPSIPDCNTTDLMLTTFLYRNTFRSENDVAGAWAYREKANGTRTGGNNTGSRRPTGTGREDGVGVAVSIRVIITAPTGPLRRPSGRGEVLRRGEEGLVDLVAILEPISLFGLL